MLRSAYVLTNVKNTIFAQQANETMRILNTTYLWFALAVLSSCANNNQTLRRENQHKDSIVLVLNASLAIKDSQLVEQKRQHEIIRDSLNLAHSKLVLEMDNIKTKMEKDNYGSSQSNIESSAFPSFPWPPPIPSARMNISLSMLNAGKLKVSRLGDVSNLLKAALTRANYYEYSYFSAMDGFALMTRIEKIEENGKAANPGRWVVNQNDNPRMGFFDYIKSLFIAPVGYFRIIVFTIGSENFRFQNKFKRDDAIALLENGSTDLPPYLRNKPWNSNMQITALIYQFEKKSNQKEADFLYPSTIGPDVHLINAGLIKKRK